MISLTAYAKHRGVSKEAVSRAIKKGRLARCVERNERGQPKIRSADEADAEWAETTRPQPAVMPPTSDDPSAAGVYVYAVEAAREKHFKANLAELEFKTKSGEVINGDEAREIVIERFTEVRTKLLGLPRRIRQRFPQLTTEDVRVIDNLVREALEALSGDT